MTLRAGQTREERERANQRQAHVKTQGSLKLAVPCEFSSRVPGLLPSAPVLGLAQGTDSETPRNGASLSEHVICLLNSSAHSQRRRLCSRRRRPHLPLFFWSFPSFHQYYYRRTSPADAREEDRLGTENPPASMV